MNDLISTSDAAARLGISELTLKTWRALGRGPVYIKVGATVRYDPCDLEAYVERQRRRPSGSPTADRPARAQEKGQA